MVKKPTDKGRPTSGTDWYKVVTDWGKVNGPLEAKPAIPWLDTPERNANGHKGDKVLLFSPDTGKPLRYMYLCLYKLEFARYKKGPLKRLKNFYRRLKFALNTLKLIEKQTTIYPMGGNSKGERLSMEIYLLNKKEGSE